MFDSLTTPIHERDGTVGVEITGRRLFAFSVAALALVKLLAVLDANGVGVPLLREFLAVVFLTFVPGVFVLLQFDYHQRSFTTTVCYAFGLSIFLVMIVGGFTSFVGPFVGIDHPLSLNALLVTWLVLTGVGAAASTNTLTLRFEKDRLADPRLPFLLLLPTTSILGSVYYELSGNNVVLLALLITIAVLPVVIAAFGDDTWYFPLAVWCIALALLYHGRVPGSYTFTQALPQVTLEHLRWIPNYGSMGSLLANGSLFPIYAIVTGLPIGIEWNLVNSVLVSFLPVTLYETFRRHVSARDALLATCLFVFAYPFYTLYTGAGRAATPVMFLALLGFAYSDDRLPNAVQRLFLLVFGIGVATTHYGTAYVVMFALFVGAVAFATLRWLVRINVARWLPAFFWKLVPGRGPDVADRDLSLSTPSVLRPSYLSYYSVFALAWYLYTAESVKFVILPRKVVAAVRGVLYLQATGSTVSSFQQNYTAIAITIAKYLYVLFGLLMTIGIAIAVLRLVIYREESVETGYLAIAIGFFSMFIGSALPSGNAFAVARVMMIIFTFAVPFAILGTRELGGIATWPLRVLSDVSLPWPDRLPSRASFAIVVAVFLLLNTGFVSETVTHDVAPSNRISEERLLNSDNSNLRLRVRACTPCDVQTHVWVGNQIPRADTIYTGVIMDNQRDYYRGTLAGQTQLGLKYRTVRYNQTDIPTGSYLAVLNHNRDLGGFAIGYKFYFFERNMSAFTSGDRLYSNGYGMVFYERHRDDATITGNRSLINS